MNAPLELYHVTVWLTGGTSVHMKRATLPQVDGLLSMLSDGNEYVNLLGPDGKDHTRIFSQHVTSVQWEKEL